MNETEYGCEYYDCYLCDYIFQTSRFLKEHIAAIHQGTLETWMKQNMDVNIIIVIFATIFPI